MSIYIHGMEMPKCCAECFCMEQEDLFCRITERPVGGKPSLYSWDPRPDNCPLVLVPEHGRTIDADVLFKKIGVDVRFGILEAMYIQGIIHDAPTIVPADKEEK